MLKVALVGVGGISGAHIPAWEAMEDAELTALCDIRPEQMDRYPDKRHYTDFDDMLAHETIDILDICLPTYLHADYAVRAMERGNHVLCEKPISLQREDVARVYAAAHQNGVCFMVAQVLRFWPEYEIVKKLYDSGRYGRLLSGVMQRIGVRPAWSWNNWMTDESLSGLVPFDLHIHDLDFMVYAFGAPKQAESWRSRRPEQDYIHVTYEYDDFCLHAEAAWYASPYPFTAGFRFQFENAVVAFEQGTLTVYERGGRIYAPLETEGAGDTGDIGLPKSDAYANEIGYFADCVRAGTFPDKVRPAELETVIDILKSL